MKYFLLVDIYDFIFSIKPCSFNLTYHSKVNNWKILIFLLLSVPNGQKCPPEKGPKKIRNYYTRWAGTKNRVISVPNIQNRIFQQDNSLEDMVCYEENIS